MQVEIACQIGTDNLRRLVPKDYAAFILCAFEVGLAALDRENPLGPWRRRAFREMFHIFQLVRRMQEHQERNFDSAADLTVRVSGRGAEIGATVFPEDLRLDQGRCDAPLSTDRIIQKGYALAIEAGETPPSEQVAIHHGLVAAASLQPLEVPDDQVPGLVRRALFDFESIGNPDPQILDWVTERLLTIINAHLPDTREKFDKWFFPGKGNLIKAIADKARSPGGKLPHDEVRKAVLHLGWQSYAWMAQCLDAFGRWFERALPEPLSEAERPLFDQLFFAQPEWGNLPLVLIMERGQFIRSLLIDLWQNPGDVDLIRKIHRLLHVYAEMATKRRKADRRIKDRAKGSQAVRGRKRRNGRGLSEMEPELGDAAPVGDEPLLEKIAQVLADSYSLDCPDCLAPWTMRVDGFRPSVTGKSIELELACQCGRTCKSFSIPEEDFRSLVGPLIGQ